MTIVSKFNTSMWNIFPMKTPGKIALALSGGVDSMALLHLLNGWNFNNNGDTLEIHAITIDHQLRPESRHEVEEIDKIISTNYKNSNIIHHIETVNDPINPNKLEQDARMFRYQLFYKRCSQLYINNIFFGHHLNDQLETFMLRLSSGSGIFGLKSMKIRSNFPIDNNEFKLISNRPLLNVLKQDIYDYANENRLTWFEDSSNNELITRRNKYRLMLKDDEIKSGVQKSFNKIQELTDEIEEQVNQLDNEIGCSFNKELLQLDISIPISLFERYNYLVIDRWLFKKVYLVSPISNYFHRFSSFDNKYSSTVSSNETSKSLSEDLFNRYYSGQAFTLAKCLFNVSYKYDVIELNVKRYKNERYKKPPEINIKVPDDNVWSHWINFDNRLSIRFKFNGINNNNKDQRKLVHFDKTLMKEQINDLKGVYDLKNSKYNGLPCLVNVNNEIVCLPTLNTKFGRNEDDDDQVVWEVRYKEDLYSV